MIEGEPLQNDEFLTWYRNGCTSGLPDAEAAKKYFESLAPEEQKSLLEEYTNMINLPKDSGWTAPFAG